MNPFDLYKSARPNSEHEHPDRPWWSLLVNERGIRKWRRTDRKEVWEQDNEEPGDAWRRVLAVDTQHPMPPPPCRDGLLLVLWRPSAPRGVETTTYRVRGVQYIGDVLMTYVVVQAGSTCEYHIGQTVWSKDGDSVERLDPAVWPPPLPFYCEREPGACWLMPEVPWAPPGWAP